MGINEENIDHLVVTDKKAYVVEVRVKPKTPRYRQTNSRSRHSTKTLPRQKSNTNASRINNRKRNRRIREEERNKSIQDVVLDTLLQATHYIVYLYGIMDRFRL